MPPSLPASEVVAGGSSAAQETTRPSTESVIGAADAELRFAVEEAVRNRFLAEDVRSPRGRGAIDPC